MTDIGEAAGRVVAKLQRRGRAVAVPTPANTNAAVPVLSDDLRQQIARLQPVRFGDFVLEPPEPVHHPDAARYAEDLHRTLAPAPESAIRAWFMILAGSLGPGVIPAAAILAGLLLTCGELPAPCWATKPPPRS
jgi:hypothetical protein